MIITGNFFSSKSDEILSSKSVLYVNPKELAPG